MADNHCADFGAKPTSVAGLCLMGPGENAGVITYDDGSIATITKPHADQPAGFYVEPSPSDTDRTPIRLDLTTPSIDRMKELQGDQLGSCSAQGMGSTFSFTTLSSSMSWPSATKGDIRHLIWGPNAGNRPHLVITCSDPTYQGLTGVNNSPSNHQLYVDAVNSLNKSCGAFDGAHCEALRESLSAAAGLPPPSSSSLFLEILKYGGTLLGVAFAFGVVVPWLQKWLGPKDGGHGGGGGGGKRSKEASDVVTKEKSPAVETTRDTVVTPAPALHEDSYKLFLETENLKENFTAWDVVVKLRDSKHHPKLLKELMGLLRDPQFNDYTPQEQTELAQRLVKAHVTEPDARKRPEWHAVEEPFHDEVQARRTATEKRTQDVTKVERRVDEQKRNDEEHKEERRIAP